jgi:hypothetical protein
MIKYWREQGIKIVMFLDDGLCGENSYEKSNRISHQIQVDLGLFGFLIAHEKCDWTPRVEVTWLGEVWNTERNLVKVTDARVSKLVNTLDWFIEKVAGGQLLVQARDVASIVGQVISMQGAVGNAVRLRTRGLYTCMLARASWESPILIDESAWKEAVFWKENIHDLNGSVLEKKDDCDIVVYSDASATGYGGYVVQRDDSEVLGTWSRHEVTKSSTWRELEGVYRVLNSEKECLKDRCVKWFTDNKNVVFIIETGSRKADLQAIAVKLYEVCTQYNIDIFPVWINREGNVMAYYLSKIVDCDDWCISHVVFQEIDSMWGPHTVDRFSFDYNSHCSRFNSRWWCPGTEGIDSFKYSWREENNWLVPPPRLISETLRKMENEKSNGTLVIPEWKSAPFWPILFESDTFQQCIKDWKCIGKSCTIRGRGNNGVFGEYLSFNMIAVRIEH